MNKYFCSFIFLLLACFIGASSSKLKAQPIIPDSAAARAFSLANKLCNADHGKMWGVSLCGPMMFVAIRGRVAVLNEPVQGATRNGSIWRIKLPDSIPLANTAVHLKGNTGV